MNVKISNYSYYYLYTCAKHGVVSWEKLQVLYTSCLKAYTAATLGIHLIDGAHETALKFTSDPSE